MSLINKLKSLLGGGSSPDRDRKRVFIVDAAGLAGGRQSPDRLGPRDQIQILNQLSRFAKAEGIRLCAVFDSKPLREVDDGGEFNGVTVYFTNREKSLDAVILSEAKASLRKGPVMVVCGSYEQEKQAVELGASVMRAVTLRKAMDGGLSGGGGGEYDRGDRGGGDRSRHSRRRPQRSRPNFGGSSQPGQPQAPGSAPSSAPESSPPASSETPARPAPSEGNSGPSDAVRNLIDLVE